MLDLDIWAERLSRINLRVTRTLATAESSRRERVFVFLFFFVLILVLKFSVVHIPPVWDGSMGLFPAAITLAANDFDVGFLLAQPTFGEGGPNIHSLSPVTWITAGFIYLFGPSTWLLPLLHLAHFAVAAVAASAVFALARPAGFWLAGLASLAGLTLPVVLTQAGYVYLEIPLLAASAFAVLAWVRDDTKRAVAWAVLAVLIKGTGIIVGAGLALAVLFGRHRDRRNVSAGLAMIGIPAVVLLAVIAVSPSYAGAGGVNYLGYLVLMMHYLVRTPDVLVLVMVFVLVAFVQARRYTDTDRESTSGSDRAVTGVTSLTFAFFAFYAAAPVVVGSALVLPRYYTQLAPLLVVGLVLAALKVWPKWPVGLLLVVLLGWSMLNRNGELYPDNSLSNFSLAERSGAYLGMVQLQSVEMRAMEELPDDVPVFYDQSSHMRFAYPEMGYAAQPLENGYYVRADDRSKNGLLDEFPDEFYFVYEYPWLGGEILRSVLKQAEADPRFSVTIRILKAQQFQSQLVHVVRISPR